MPHGGPRLAGFVGGVRAVRAGDGQLGVVVGDVGVGAGLHGRHCPAWQLVVLLLLLHLQRNGRYSQPQVDCYYNGTFTVRV